MNVFLQLIKITSSSVEPGTDEKKKSKAFGTVMAVLIIFCLFIPICAFAGFMVYALTHGIVVLQAADPSYSEYTNAAQAGLNMMLHIIALFSFIFGFNVVMSVFFFSSDLNYLLPLPISPMKIVGAKLAATMISENVMELLLVMSALIGFMAGYGFSPAVGNGLNAVSFLSMIIGMATFPVLPISYCAVICMIVMFFTKFFKNKDSVSKVTALSSVVILLALAVFLQVTNGFDADRFVEQLISGEFTLIDIADKIFISVPLLSNAMAGNILSLVLYLLVNAVCVGLVLVTAHLLYFKTVVALNGGQGKASRGANEEILEKKIKESSHLETYLKKEFRILFRTPAYLTNCVGINLIWPIFIYLFVIMQKQSNILENYLALLKAGDEKSVLDLSLIVFAVSVILTALNCLASSAITREGKHFDVMRYMPVDLMTQLNSKALVSIIISGTGLIVYILTAFIIFDISPFLTSYSLLLSILAVVFTTYLGIYIDTINPKLVWEDEVNALRGNYHVFYNMGLELIITGVLCVIMELLFSLGFLPVALLQSLLLIISALLCLWFYKLCRNKGTKNLMKIEL